MTARTEDAPRVVRVLLELPEQQARVLWWLSRAIEVSKSRAALQRDAAGNLRRALEQSGARPW